MFRFVGSLCDRICAVLAAIIFMQLPLFISQYMQQLTGREAELRLQVDAMRQAARISGKSLEELINKFVSSSDGDFIRQGELMQSMLERWEGMFKSLVSLQQSSIFAKPFNFILHLNTETFSSTLKNYSFGLPVTIEGAIYAFCGLVVGYLLFSGLRRLIRKTTSFLSNLPADSSQA